MKTKSLTELQVSAEAVLELAKAQGRKHPFGQYGKSVLLPDGKLYSPSPATVHYATETLFPYILDFYIRTGKTPSHTDIRRDLSISSVDRVRKLLHVLIGLRYIAKNEDTGVFYPVGDADQATAIDILKNVTPDFVRRLSALNSKDKALVKAMVKYIAKSKWILTKDEEHAAG